MITKTSEYALRAAVFLADASHGHSTSAEIASRTRVPERYLSKVLHALVEAGLVESRRGPRGGFSLRRPGREVSMLDVVRAVEPSGRVGVCPLGIEAHAEGLCTLHARLDELAAGLERGLGETSIASLLEGKPGPLGLGFGAGVGRASDN